MKILIATGVYPPKVGGPAQYAVNLEKEWRNQGHDVFVATYDIEHKLPVGVRHLVFFFKALFKLLGTDFCLALDTFSAGVPAMLACKVMRKPLIVRVGGDFLWELYLNRTKEKVMLSDFYNKKRNFTFKENIIFKLSRWLFGNASGVAFNTRWQANIFARPYGLDMEKVSVIENYYGEKQEGESPRKKNYLWHVRKTFLKNEDVVRKAFAEADKNCPDAVLEEGEIPYQKLLDKLSSCWAVVLPSISDVSPNYTIDALSFGKPAIMTEDTGLREKLEGVVWFVDPFDEKGLARAICDLSKPEVYKKWVERAESFDFKHSWKEIADEFIEIANAKTTK